MQKIGIISDTHGILPDATNSFFAQCNEIWHAGDIGSKQVLEQLSQIALVRAVFGNIDSQEIRQITNSFLFFKIENMSVLLTHIGGRPYKYVPQAQQLINMYKPSIFVCGHSHILLIQYNKKYNLLHLNPGAAGSNGFHIKQTLLRFKIDGEKISEMEIWEKSRYAVI